MRVSTAEAKDGFSALIARAERGEAVTITRRGVPVARLVPVEPEFDRAAARRAREGLLAASRGVTLGDLTIRELIDEGRR